MYSTPQWGMVKSWEMMNEFQLEGFGQSIFGSAQADQRAWRSFLPFETAPHALKMPTQGVPGLRNGSRAAYVYLSNAWYHLQLILDNSNKQQAGHNPIDWGYSYGFVKDMASLVTPQAALHTMWLIKSLQILNNGMGPQFGENGWQPSVANLSPLVAPVASYYEWLGVPAATRTALSEGILRAWLGQASQWTPQQYYAGNWASASVNPVPGQSDGTFANQVWFMIPQFRYFGVNQTLINQVADWAKTIWPNANWDATKTATCSAVGPLVTCSTEH
jgi:hypothetical protein